MIKSLQARQEPLAKSEAQVAWLENEGGGERFSSKLQDCGLYPLRATGVTVLQVNLGKMCNQVCKHCHVDAGPDRKEIMTKETMQQCLDVLASTDIPVVDLTGGAPEMNPHFRWFVEEISALGRKVMVRCNLTIILANPKYHDLPEFFKKHQVEVVSSLPAVTALRTDAQRGKGVFDKSIKALQMLNAVGYGQEGTGLKLNLVYNPSGAFMSGSQEALEKEFKSRLSSRFDIIFNQLYAITNLPVSRFLEFLVESGNYDAYMDGLIEAFNPAAAEGVMCRNTISVGWDGYLYDCDFNQMLDLKVAVKNGVHIKDYNAIALNEREIVLGQHCYGCTAGAGSSCGGQTA